MFVEATLDANWRNSTLTASFLPAERRLVSALDLLISATSTPCGSFSCSVRNLNHYSIVFHQFPQLQQRLYVECSTQEGHSVKTNGYYIIRVTYEGAPFHVLLFKVFDAQKSAKVIFCQQHFFFSLSMSLDWSTWRTSIDHFVLCQTSWLR